MQHSWLNVGALPFVRSGADLLPNDRQRLMFWEGFQQVLCGSVSPNTAEYNIDDQVYRQSIASPSNALREPTWDNAYDDTCDDIYGTLSV